MTTKTREEELNELVAEQFRDDHSYVVWPDGGSAVSLDMIIGDEITLLDVLDQYGQRKSY